MRAIVLAGGLGTRLREVLPDLPKPMAPIQGKPFLEYLIHWLIKWHFKTITLCVCYKKEIIMDYFKDGKSLGVTIDYSIEDSPLGTGGALKKALKNIQDRQVLVLNGDSFLDLDINAMLTFHNAKLALATIAITKAENNSRFGGVILDNRDLILEFNSTTKKKVDNKFLINGGIYLFDKEIYKFIPDGCVSLESEVFNRIIGKGLYGFLTNGFFIDMGIPSDYKKLNESVRNSMLGQCLECSNKNV